MYSSLKISIKTEKFAFESKIMVNDTQMNRVLLILLETLGKISILM